MGSMTVVKQLLMIGGGVITGLPMVFTPSALSICR